MSHLKLDHFDFFSSNCGILLKANHFSSKKTFIFLRKTKNKKKTKQNKTKTTTNGRNQLRHSGNSTWRVDITALPASFRPSIYFCMGFSARWKSIRLIAHGQFSFFSFFLGWKKVKQNKPNQYHTTSKAVDGEE